MRKSNNLSIASIEFGRTAGHFNKARNLVNQHRQYDFKSSHCISLSSK